MNLLSADQQHLAVHCSTGAKGSARFEAGDWSLGDDSPPLLTDALAAIVCRQQTSITYGTHQLFIGSVQKVLRQSKIDPLVHADGRYHRLSA